MSRAVTLGLLVLVCALPQGLGSKCPTCESIVEKFKQVCWCSLLVLECLQYLACSVQGLKETEGDGFGGGNTAWEERALGEYARR